MTRHESKDNYEYKNLCVTTPQVNEVTSVIYCYDHLNNVPVLQEVHPLVKLELVAHFAMLCT